MNHRTTLATLALLLAAAVPASAQKVAPGLWEYSMTMQGAGGGTDPAMARMQEQMARMSPEERKQIEAMMAGRGIRMGGGVGQPMSVKICITPEQAAREEMAPPDSNCKQVSRERSGNTMRFKFACSGEHQGTGEGEYTFTSDKAHQGRVVITGVGRDGQPHRIEMLHSGRWLGADCGDVKPRRPPAATTPPAKP